MCRVLIYLGSQSVRPYDLLYGPDNSLIHQSYDPKLMKHIQNLAGFGMVAWTTEFPNEEMPFYYKSKELPFFDQNLLNLSKRINSHCILAHVRGVDYSANEIVVRQNAHPFMYEDYTLALAHNGSIADLDLMKPILINMLKPEVIKKITGNTDSEWFYALLMSQFDDPTAAISLDEACAALTKTFQLIREIRIHLKIKKASPVNIFITNGEYLVVTRFVYNFGLQTEQVEKAFLEYHSLWFTFGEEYGCFDGVYKMRGHKKRANILFASEPLTEDRTSWVELPEYSLTKAWVEKGNIIVRTQNLNI